MQVRGDNPVGEYPWPLNVGIGVGKRKALANFLAAPKPAGLTRLFCIGLPEQLIFDMSRFGA